MIYSLALKLWSLLVRLFGPILIKKRLKSGLENPDRFTERYGLTQQQRPSGTLVWLHGASVGESLSILPLIEKMTNSKPDWHFLVTTTTYAAQKVLADRLPANAVHQFIPFDATLWVGRFLDHWQPNASFFVESEIWPNLLHKVSQRQIPITLLNARLSKKSLANWLRFKSFCAPLWAAFTNIYTQSEEFTERFHLLGAACAKTLGNIKLLAKPLPFDAQDLAFWKQKIGTRPSWVVASTHKGEDAQIFQVHQELKKIIPDLLTILAPRHVERCSTILAMANTVTMAKFSDSTLTNEDILLVDAMGKLGIFYRLSPLAFIGGSLIPQGGHNPLEPLMLGAYPIWGPHFFNFSDMMYLFEGFPCQQKDLEMLTQSVIHCLIDPLNLAQQTLQLQGKITKGQEKINMLVDDIISII